jgi:putative Mn2+ efflux pump MntP
LKLTERMSAYVTMAAADVAGLLLVLLGAMALFRALRQG